MNRFFCLIVSALLLLLTPLTGLTAVNQWGGSGPFATGLGDKVITSLAVSNDGKSVYAGTGSGTVFNYEYVPPAATTGTANSISITGATLNGTVNANNLSTVVSFDYGLTTSYGSSVTAAQSPLSGSTASAVSADIDSLTCNTSYHFRVKGINSAGTTTGDDASFTTSACPTYTVTYNGNGSESGTVPVDGNAYLYNASVTVLGNSGSLAKAGYSFTGWNTAANGSGTSYTAGSSFAMGSANVTLYAIWLGTPSATSATSISSTGFTANWDSASGASGYYLDVATDSGFSAFVSGYQNKDIGNVTSAAITGLTPGTTYYYRTRSYNSSGTGANSGTISVPTISDAPVATAATAVTATSFTANWNSSTGATGYYLDVATDSGFGSFVSGFENKYLNGVTSAAVTGLTSTTSYYYRVRANNDSGTGANSNTISVLPRYSVTPSAGEHGGINPSTAQTVQQGSSTTFTLIPDTGYHSDAVDGTCGGTLTGNSFTTNAVSADCTVIASFDINSYSVTGTASGSGSISCSAATVTHGSNVTCTITPAPGSRLAALTANGSDILGTVNLNQVTISNITADLTVAAGFTSAAYGGLPITSATADTTGYASAYTPDGTQHLVYERGGSLYYRSSTGVTGNWSDEESIVTGHDAAIAIAPDGSPVVAFLAGGQIQTTARTSGAWTTPAATGISEANSLDLAVDGAGALHLVYSVTGSDSYDDILYSNNAGGNYSVPITICDGAYASGIWTFCRTPFIQADASGNYHIAYSKQEIHSALDENDPQWMVYTTNSGGGSTITSHNLNSGSSVGTPQLLVRGSFSYDATNGYTLVYNNDLESAGLWLATNLQGGSWTESAIPVPGTLPVQGNDTANLTRQLAYLTPDSRLNQTALNSGSYSAPLELAPKATLPMVNPLKRSVIYRAADANNIQQLYQVGIDALALLTPADGNLGNIVVGQTAEKQYTLTNNGSKALNVTEVRLDNPGYTFEISSDSCTGAGLAPGAACIIKVRSVQQVTAGSTFSDTLTITSNDPVRDTLTLALTAQSVNPFYPLNLTIAGSGTVTATATGQTDFVCTGGVCSRDYDTSTTVTLTAQAPVGYSFAGFTVNGDGSDCGSSTSCSMTIAAATNVTATFQRNSYVVSTLKSGNGTIVCQSPVSFGMASTCTVTPDAGNRIEGVGGTCGGTLNGTTYTTNLLTGSCTVEAVFTSDTQRTVSVTLAGTGAGSVYSAPAAIACTSGTCTHLFDDASAVTLTAAPDSNSTFGGWSGDCSNSTGNCELSVTADKAVTATLTAAPRVMVGTNSHTTLTGAYAATTSGATIKARSITFTENLILDQIRSIQLEGGYNAPYDCNTCGEHTLLEGSLTVKKGSVVIENLTIK